MPRKKKEKDSDTTLVRRRKRPLSKYNIFVREHLLKSKGKMTMAEIAEKWNAQKKTVGGRAPTRKRKTAKKTKTKTRRGRTTRSDKK